MARHHVVSGAFIFACLFAFACKCVDARVGSTERKVEIEEYPVVISAFQIVYHHNELREENFDGMEEMSALSATRNYLASVLTKVQPENEFRRLLLYIMIRGEDETMTKVAYSGTAYFAMPTSPSSRRHIQEETWLSFLGANKTQYLLELKRHDILNIDSVTLLNAGGNAVGIDTTGGLTATTPAPTQNTSITNDNFPPNTDMSSSVSLTIILCAILTPITVLFGILAWWVVRKLRHDVAWKQPQEMGPHWQSAQRLERHFTRPLTPTNITDTTYVTGFTHHNPIPTSFMPIPDAEVEGHFLTPEPMGPFSHGEGSATESLQPRLPIHIVISPDNESTSTLGTFTSEQKRNLRVAPPPLHPDEDEQKHKPKINTKQPNVQDSFLRNPVEKRPRTEAFGTPPRRTPGKKGDAQPKAKKASLFTPVSKDDSTSRKSNGRQLKSETAMQSTSASASSMSSTPSSRQRNKESDTPQSPFTETMSSFKNKEKKRSDVEHAVVPIKTGLPRRRDSTKLELRAGLPPTPRPRESNTCRESSKRRGSRSRRMEPQACRALASGASNKEGAPKTTNDPPGAKLVSIKAAYL